MKQGTRKQKPENQAANFQFPISNFQLPTSKTCNLQILSPRSEKVKPAGLISFAALTGFSRKNAAKRW
jgi:hypothetical protein